MPRMASQTVSSPLASESLAEDAPVRLETRGVSYRPAWSWNWKTELLVFVFVALMLRLFVVWKTPLITKDGLIYIGIARTIEHGLWLQLVGDWFLFNPYPALIAWFSRQGFDFELAGQLINAIASALTVIPIYLWCKSAFDRQIAQLTALTFAFHPVVLRFSGQVLREGLYWNLMCWGIYIYWQAAAKGGWWRYLLAGLFATGATLTRMEGAFVFLLGGLWIAAWTAYRNQAIPGVVPREIDTGSSTRNTSAVWLSYFHLMWRPGLLWLTSLAMFPATLVLLNVVFIPAGEGWQGGGRWMHFAIQMLVGKDLQVAEKPVPLRMAKLAELEQRRLEQTQPPAASLRDLAKSLPVWNSLGEPDVAQLRMQRFLILAEDQQRYIFVGRFCNECIEGLSFPTVICCLWGLYYKRRTGWTPHRDWPLAVYTLSLIALLFFHLSREFILEQRYLFCLMPLVFPWSCVGARDIYQRMCGWFEAHPAWSTCRPSGAALVVLLMLFGCGKLWIGLDDRSKAIQREIGTHLRQVVPYRMKIAGPESLKRIGHYADADFFIIPKGNPADVEEWLNQIPLDFVVLSDDETQTISSERLKLEVHANRYRHLYSSNNRRNAIQVFSVRHLAVAQERLTSLK